MFSAVPIGQRQIHGAQDEYRQAPEGGSELEIKKKREGGTRVSKGEGEKRGRKERENKLEETKNLPIAFSTDGHRGSMPL